LGSHRVATINFNRIALEATSIDEFWKIYQQRIEDAKLINDIIGTNEAKINMTDGNTYFVLIDIFKKYEERTNPKANGL
jgi:anaerobic ribonucleoside-triphosphate reductase